MESNTHVVLMYIQTYSNIPFEKLLECCQFCNVGNDGKCVLTIEDLEQLREEPKLFSLYKNETPNQPKNVENPTLDTPCFRRFHDMYNLQVEVDELIL